MAGSSTIQSLRRPLGISEAATLRQAGMIMAAMIGLSRITGFGRLIVTSWLFGKGMETDAYLAAFNIPDTLSILISGGLLATGFVPVFTSYLALDQHEKAQRTFRSLLTLISAGFGIISVILFGLTYTPLGTLLAPSTVNPHAVHLYLYILRILLFSQFLFVVGGVFSGTLNALRLFWYPALQPVLFNCGTIVFGIAGRHYGIGAQAWGALFGAGVGTCCVLGPAAWRHGLSLKPLWDANDEGVRRVAASLLPVVMGLASGQIIALNLPRAFAKFLPVGSTSTLDYANRLMQVPLDVLASSAAVALLPTISRLWVEHKPLELNAAFGKALARNISVMLFATSMTIALAQTLIHLLLEHGKFGHEATLSTAAVLRCYALCLPALGTQQLLARGFYATNRSQEPVAIGFIAVVLFFVFGAVAVQFPVLGPSGLALAAAASTSIMSAMLWWTLRRHLGDLEDKQVVRSALTSLIMAVVVGISAHYVGVAMHHFLHHYDTDRTFGPLKLAVRTSMFVVPAAIGSAIWIVAGSRLGVADLRRRTA